MQMDVTSTETSQSWIFPEYLLIFLAKLEMDNITDLRVLFNDTALKKLASLNTKYVLTLRERIRMVMTSYKQPKCVPIFKGEANYEYWFYVLVVGGNESKNWVFEMVMALICFQRRGDVECNPAAENEAIIMAQWSEHAHVRGKFVHSTEKTFIVEDHTKI